MPNSFDNCCNGFTLAFNVLNFGTVQILLLILLVHGLECFLSCLEQPLRMSTNAIKLINNTCNFSLYSLLQNIDFKDLNCIITYLI